VVLLDDEIVGGSTVLAALDHVLAEGAATVRVACTHGLFVGDVLRRLQGRSEVVEIISTDSVAISPEKRVPKLTVVSVAAVLARSIDLLRSGPVGQEEAPPAAVR
jgi:ribose-phosphate pyrophosphokinase